MHLERDDDSHGLPGLLLGWLATGVAAGKTAGQAAGTRHAVSRLFTCRILPDNCFFCMGTFDQLYPCDDIIDYTSST
jgi:hypothetical protein